MHRKRLSSLLLIIGLLLLVYPGGEVLYKEYRQQRLLQQWQDSLAVVDDGMAETGNLPLAGGPERAHTGMPGETEGQEPKSEPKAPHSPQGVLIINKIGLRLPILKGATEENLNLSVASLEDSAEPGRPGNYALAAHRSHTYGQLFNRLEELETGDSIQIETGTGLYRYSVTAKLYVKPEETWVLKESGTGEEITLITCHPMINPTHRLIIKGHLAEPVAKEFSGKS